MSDIREMLNEIFEQNIDKYSVYSEKAKVTAVAESAGTCTVELVADDAEITDVPFKTVKGDGTGFFVVPEVNSYVMVTWLNNEVCFVSLVQKYSKVSFTNGSITMVLDGSNITMNAGSDTAARAQALENKLNDLITELDAHTHTGGSGGPVTAPPASSFSSFNKGDFESPNVKI